MESTFPASWVVHAFLTLGLVWLSSTSSTSTSLHEVGKKGAVDFFGMSLADRVHTQHPFICARANSYPRTQIAIICAHKALRPQAPGSATGRIDEQMARSGRPMLRSRCGHSGTSASDARAYKNGRGNEKEKGKSSSKSFCLPLRAKRRENLVSSQNRGSLAISASPKSRSQMRFADRRFALRRSGLQTALRRRGHRVRDRAHRGHLESVKN